MFSQYGLARTVQCAEGRDLEAAHESPGSRKTDDLVSTVTVPVPRTTGPHRLSIGLAQDGEPFPDLLASDAQIVRPR